MKASKTTSFALDLEPSLPAPFSGPTVIDLTYSDKGASSYALSGAFSTQVTLSGEPE